jgi:uncharacterized protein YbaA (DUF1428 family)
MTYVDGVVLAVPTKNKSAYLELSKRGSYHILFLLVHSASSRVIFL